MDVTPSQLSGAEFTKVRKGYDPAEVDALLARAAEALEDARQQSTAMEARARAAVARLQEMTEQHASEDANDDAGDEVGADAEVAREDAEVITRTLLLAQRSADAAIAEATDEALRIRGDARTEAETTLDSTREMSAQLIDEARLEARRASEAEVRAAENEVQSLVARREFLVGDVDQLEQFLVEQRERLREAARAIDALCERIPGGLGSVAAPALSAADDEPGDDTAGHFRPADVHAAAARIPPPA